MNKTAIAGMLLSFPVTAFNPNGPDHPLRWSLRADAPPSAGINSTNGIFAWRPPAASESYTQLVTIEIADSLVPSLKQNVTAQIIVLPPPSLNAAASPDGAVQLSFSTFPATLYRIQFKRSLSDPVWSNLGPVTVGQGGCVLIKDLPNEESERYYRLALLE